MPIVDVTQNVHRTVEVRAAGPQGPAGADGNDGAAGQDGQGVPTGGTTGQQLAKASATDHDTQWTDPVSTTPAGALLQYAGATIPTGWLNCDGSAVSRTTYAALFTAVGVRWGSGDGSTTFNLPDMRGRIPIGVTSAHGSINAVGKKTGSFDHTHSATLTGAALGYAGGPLYWGSYSAGDYQTLVGTDTALWVSVSGTTQSANPPVAAVNMIIKT